MWLWDLKEDNLGVKGLVVVRSIGGMVGNGSCGVGTVG